MRFLLENVVLECEFCQKCNFDNMNFLNQVCDFEHVNFWMKCGFSPQCGVQTYGSQVHHQERTQVSGQSIKRIATQLSVLFMKRDQANKSLHFCHVEKSVQILKEIKGTSSGQYSQNIRHFSFRLQLQSKQIAKKKAFFRN